MSAPRLTKRLLTAMDGALSAMLAGMEGDGDWPEGVSHADMDDAQSWVCYQLAKRAALISGNTGK